MKLSCQRVSLDPECTLQTSHVTNALNSSTWTVQPFEVGVCCRFIACSGAALMSEPVSSGTRRDVRYHSALPNSTEGWLRTRSVSELWAAHRFIETWDPSGGNTNCINSVVYHKKTLNVSCVVSNQYLMLQRALLGFRNTILKLQSTQRIKNNLCMSC